MARPRTLLDRRTRMGRHSRRLRRVLWIAHLRAVARRIIRDHNTLFPDHPHPFTGEW